MVMNRVGLNGAEGARAASVLTLFAGIWLIISPFWGGFYTVPAPLWNTLIVGVGVTVLALIRAAYPTENVGLSWINLILGLWLIVSPSLLRYHDMALPQLIDMVTGFVIGLTAFWSLLATPRYAPFIRYRR
jgi:hypothetical protein